MNRQYDINDWAREQRNAKDAKALANAATYWRLKFPRTNNVIAIVVAVISFFVGLNAGIEAHRKPLGVILYAVGSALIGGTFAYAFAILLIVIALVVVVIKLIQPYL